MLRLDEAAAPACCAVALGVRKLKHLPGSFLLTAFVILSGEKRTCCFSPRFLELKNTSHVQERPQSSGIQLSPSKQQDSPNIPSLCQTPFLHHWPENKTISRWGEGWTSIHRDSWERQGLGNSTSKQPWPDYFRTNYLYAIIIFSISDSLLVITKHIHLHKMVTIRWNTYIWYRLINCGPF